MLVIKGSTCLSTCLLTKFLLKTGTYILALICFLIATEVTQLSYNNPCLFTVVCKHVAGRPAGHMFAHYRILPHPSQSHSAWSQES